MILLTRPASGDEIMMGEETLHRVELKGYESGRIKYRTPKGQYETVSIRDVDFLVITSMLALSDFNEAEEYLLKGNHIQAVERYERSLRTASGFWKNLATVRLLVATDRANLPLKAVNTFLSVAQSDVATACQFIPDSLPAGESRATQKAIDLLEKDLRKTEDENTRKLLTLVRFEILRRLDRPEAAETCDSIASLEIPKSMMTDKTAAIKMSAIELMKRKNLTVEALEQIDRLVASIPETQLPAILLLKAQTLYEVARSDEDYLQAAIPAMRVAIHYPDSEYTGECLLLAAAAHSDSGRSQDAIRILRQCLINSAVGEEIKTRARQELQRLAETNEP